MPNRLTRIVFGLFLSILSIAYTTGCVRTCGFDPSDLAKWYIVQTPTKTATTVDCGRVVFLETEPTDRNFSVIGLIAPPDGAFDSYAETINAVRTLGALYGADAVVLVSENSSTGWGFIAGRTGAGGGSKETIRVRAKAIVWR